MLRSGLLNVQSFPCTPIHSRIVSSLSFFLAIDYTPIGNGPSPIDRHTFAVTTAINTQHSPPSPPSPIPSLVTCAHRSTPSHHPHPHTHTPTPPPSHPHTTLPLHPIHIHPAPSPNLTPHAILSQSIPIKPYPPFSPPLLPFSRFLPFTTQPPTSPSSPLHPTPPSTPSRNRIMDRYDAVQYGVCMHVRNYVRVYK